MGFNVVLQNETTERSSGLVYEKEKDEKLYFLDWVENTALGTRHSTKRMKERIKKSTGINRNSGSCYKNTNTIRLQIQRYLKCHTILKTSHTTLNMIK